VSDSYYPSVQVSERLFRPASATSQTTTTSAAFIGRSSQGPVTPTLVTSWASFTTLFGTDYTDLHMAVNDFFGNGGRQAYITRIAGANAVPADIDVFDATAPNTSGTPLFTVTATSPGVWGNNLRLVTYLRDQTNKRFDVALFRVPTGTTFDPAKRNTEYLVDQWIDVTLNPSSSRYLYSIANAPSATGSQLVTFAGQSYNPATPAVQPMPSTVVGGNVFGVSPGTAGVDGIYTTPYTESTAYAAALASYETFNGPFILNLPGVTTPGTIKDAITTAAARGDMFVVVDTAAGLTPAAALTFLNTDLNLSALGGNVASFAAVYYPHVHMPAIGSGIPGRTVLRPPGGALAGLMMSTDVTVGPWKAPAGLTASIAGAVAPERLLTAADLTSLNNNHINAIRSIRGAGIVVMGARTTKKSGLDRYVNVRRTVMEITETLKASTQFAIFENNDERLWGRVAAVCSRYLGTVWQAGGLRGNGPGEAFYVKCDGSNNTPATIEQGAVNVEVGIAPLTPAEFVIISIGQYDGGAEATVRI